MPKHPTALIRLLALWLLLLPPVAFARAPSGVGLAPLKARDPVGGGEMNGFVFYPSTQRPAGVTPVGPYAVQASFGAPAQPGAKPLVVISHGNGGTRLGHHDLATWLAGRGFVVATFDHPGDNSRDQSGVGTPAVLVGRPRQVSAVIDSLLADPRWKALIDPERIGVAGFSAGGYTSLMVVGARPHFARIYDYCERYPQDEVICHLRPGESKGSPAAQKRLTELQEAMTRSAPVGDARVKAAFVIAPFSLLFDKEGLAPISRPVFLAYSEEDRVLRPSENALHIRPLLKTLAGVRAIPKADHWVFLAPCTKELATKIGELCTDPAGVDRVRVHAQLEEDALAFFRKALR